jgi:SAM-dependent methyltransferase
MTIKVDPEENEIGALFDFVDLDGARVLEIGSGDCRLTWRYAERAEQVTAVEPFGPAITRARQHLPRGLEGRVVLRQAGFAEFAAQAPASAFDVTIFSWSLCCMEQDRMVSALEEAHRLLRPSGTLIDIHPVFGTAQLEVHSGGSRLSRTGADCSAETRDHVSRGAPARHRGHAGQGRVRAVVVELDRSLVACTGVPA